jgi:RHS repeat-associated protein
VIAGGKEFVDLYIAIKDPANPDLLVTELTDRIRIEQANAPANRIETLEFADGTSTATDAIGPAITDILFDNNTINARLIIHGSGPITFNVSDPDGVKRVELSINSAVVLDDSSGAGSYTYNFDISGRPDGIYSFTLQAFDFFDNKTSVTYFLEIAIILPEPPVIITPVNGDILTSAEITVSGTAEPKMNIVLLLNGQPYGNPTPTNPDGSFSLPVTLVERANTISAIARNNAGDSPRSGEITATLNTLLDNPTDLDLISEVDHLTLSWAPVGSADIFDHYNIYLSETSFTSVAGMSPVQTVTAATVDLSGLTIDTTYYLAVTSVNYAGGEKKTVVPVSGHLKDVTGPLVSDLLAGIDILAAGYAFTSPAAITLNASDFSGIDRVEFLIDGSPFCTDVSGPDYNCFLNIVALSDGQHLLTIKAYDTLGNLTALELPFTVALALPKAPVIGQPVNGAVFSSPEITVSGTAEKFTEVELVNNGVSTGVTAQVDDNGHFSLNYSLTIGANLLSAKAFNRTGSGPASGVVAATFLLANPSGVTTVSEVDNITLSWQQVEPVADLQHYNLYVSETAFTSVAAMTPAQSVTTTSGALTGLKQDTKYHLAVTSVDSGGGERQQVSTVLGNLKDVNGPVLSALTYNSAPVAATPILSAQGSFSLTGTDFSGVSHVEFYLDNVRQASDANGPVYSWDWNILAVADGSYTVTVKGYDSLGNLTAVDYPLNVALTPPPAPLLIKPTGTTTNNREITISGTAAQYAEVVVLNNGLETSALAQVAADGKFSLLFSLAEGENSLRVAARYANRTALGPLSNSVNVSLDTTIPLPPTDLTGQAKAAGQVRLSWQAPLDASVKGYNLYRQGMSFSGRIGKVNGPLITAGSYTDLPPAEGEYFYRVEVVDVANNFSDLSAETSVANDLTPPRATAIEFVPHGNYDPFTGRMAPGLVEITMAVNEPLATTPFLSITPTGGAPSFIDLTKVSETEFSGTYTITPSTPSGTAYLVFSARDLVGNRGTEIDSGATLAIDTAGPAVADLVVEPAGLIRNDSAQPATITVTLGLTEPVNATTTPQLSYRLSGLGRLAENITDLVEIDPPLASHLQTWQATFTLPADAGEAESETFSFTYSSTDDLDNRGGLILANNLFQVYQGNLPPLPAPVNLQAQVRPGGKVGLAWDPVAAAVGYQLYRQAPGETELTVLQTIVADPGYLDATEIDGQHTYAVTTIRQENGQESISGLSTTVTVTTDSIAPSAPSALALYLDGRGVQLSWTPPVYTEPITYNIYRQNLLEITTVEGLTRYASGGTLTAVTDPSPSLTDHSYVVTAVDAVGNESAPSNSEYLNFKLLPVSSLTVTRVEDDMPVVNWTHNGSTIAGYELLLGDAGLEVKLNSGLITSKSYVDTGFTSGERRYTVIAVDGFGEKSAGRSLVMPDLKASLQPGSAIKRGLMNRVEYLVENRSDFRVDHIELRVRVAGIDHLSDEFSLEAGASMPVSVRIGGYDSLKDIETLTNIIEVTPNAGESVKLVRSEQVAIGEGALNLSIINEEFTRGVDGSVRFSLENTGDEEIEIVTATGSGSKPSNEISFKLQDKDGNVLASKNFKQTIGEGFHTMANGLTVVRIPAGGTFVSAPVTLSVPGSAPDEVVVRLNIAKIRFHTGRSDAVAMNGISATLPLSLADTSYYGEILDITPEESTGDQDIVISGRAVARETGAPMANAALEVVVSVSGFDRTYNVITGSDGLFSHQFVPLPGESGIYTVRAVHPDLLDRPVQGSFVITRTYFSPATFNITIPRNYKKGGSVRFTTGAGTVIDNLQLKYLAVDQPGGVFPAGLAVTAGAPVVSLGGNQAVNLPFTFWADNDAPETFSFFLRVVSDQSGEQGHGKVRVNLNLVEVTPALFVYPVYLETGILQGQLVTESMTLHNKGLGDMNDVSLSLIDQNGAPAPSWVKLSSAAEVGDIPSGESRVVNFSFAPNSTVAEGYYTYYLRVKSSNHATRDIGLYPTVTTSDMGDAIFSVADIYTGTLDGNNNPIPGLKGAKVFMQRELAPIVEKTVYTDGNGEASFTDLPSGSYKYRITASNHQEKIGRIWIKPGVIATESVFLDYNLVTVEWSVTETTIEDKYEVVLKATYETNVPAAVVVASPSSINLPPMQAGDVYNGEFTLTNHGLIRAEEVNFSLPPDNEFFHYELLEGLPDTIEAGQKVTVPYKVVCIKSPSLSDSGSDSGGGCMRNSNCIVTQYIYYCASGDKTSSTTRHCTVYDNGECTASSGSTQTFPVSSSGSGGGGGSSSSYSGYGSQNTSSFSTPPPTSLNTDSKCIPDPPRPCGANQCCLTGVPSRSSVDILLGEYTDKVTDFSVKIPGGTLDVTRRYFDGAWRFDHLDENIIIDVTTESIGKVITTEIENGVVIDVDEKEIAETYLYYNGVKYHGPSTPPSRVDSSQLKYYENGTTLLVGSTYRFRSEAEIVVLEYGFQWHDKYGNWARYDGLGQLERRGDKNGPAVIYHYSGGLLTGISDVNDNQVLWFEYDTDGTLTAIRDAEDSPEARTVNYTIVDSNLVKVVDVLGQTTNYYYGSEGLVRKVEPGGKISEIDYHPYELELIEKPVVKGLGSGVGGGSGSAYSPRIPSSSEEQEPVVKPIRYQVASVRDQYGVGKSFEYDYDSVKGEYYSLVRHSSGKTVETWFNGEGDKIRVKINGELVEKLTIEGRTKTTTDRNGNETVRTYDEWDNLLKEVYPDSTSVSYTYNYQHPSGQQLKTSRTDEQGVKTVYSYDDFANRTSVTEAVGTAVERTTSYNYDGYGNVLSITKSGDAVTAATTTVMAYDTFGNMVSLTDGEGNVTTFSHDNQGNVLTSTDPNGKVTTYTYDAKGRRLSVTDPLGNISTSEYNGRDLVAKAIDPLLNETLFAYDSYDRPITVTDALGNSSEMRYDADGNLLKRTDPEGRAVHSVYDEEGRLAKTIDGNGNEIVYDYGDSGGGSCSACALSGNNQDQPVRITFPTFSREFVYDLRGRKIVERDILDDYTVYETGYRYDDTGNLIAKIDRYGRETSYEYDNLKRLVRTVDGDFKETRFSYDNRDNLLTLTDAEGNTTSFTYDRNNRLLSETRPGGETTFYTYDKNGRLATKIDPLGNKQIYEYDAAGRLIHTYQYAADNLLAPARTITYSYDAAGRLLGYDDGESSGTYSYDTVGRKTTETVDYGPFSLSQSYGYYRNGTKQSYTGPDGVAYAYSYDGNNQLSGVEVPGQGFVSVNGYTWNRPNGVTLPGGSVKSYGYDGLMRLTGIGVNDPAGNSLIGYSYTHDREGNITNKATEHGDYAYGYDNLYRLTSADNPILADEGYSYDAVGNRLTAAGMAEEFVYNDNNELVDYGNVTFAYDANGNTVKRINGAGNTVHGYSYDADNRLVAVADGGGAEIGSYGYDPFGRRLWKEVDGVRTYFLYSDEGLVGEYDATGNAIKTYGWWPGSTWGTDPLFMAEGGQYYWYLNDHLGTPQKMINTSGQVVWSAVYDAFGLAEVDAASVVENNLRFPGQYYDVETGLHYNWNRYYDPATGRYITADPIGLAGGNNLYLYANANPIMFIDPSGLDNVGCDIGPFKFIESACVLECCAAHDKCYDDENCTAKSWCFGSPECGECNNDVSSCIILCIGSGKDDPEKPNYYCPKLGKYVTIPGDFPDIKSAEKACNNKT